MGNKQKFDMNKEIQIIHLKMTLDFLQIMAICRDIQINWPQNILRFFEAQLKIGDPSNQIFSFDCVASSYVRELPYLRLILICFLPLFLIFLIASFFWILSILKEISFKDHAKIGMIIVCFIMQPNIINACFGVLSCTQIDPDRYFLTFFKNMECYTDGHNLIIFLLVLPGLIFWVIALPSFISWSIWRDHQRMAMHKLSTIYGFLSIGFKPDKFYWELFILIRKIILMITIRLSNLDGQSKTLLALAIISISFFLHSQAEPFLIDKMNLFENHSLILILITLFLGFLNSLEDNFGLKDSFISIFFILNIIFTLYWIFEIWIAPWVKKGKILKTKTLSIDDSNKKSYFDRILNPVK